MLIIRKFPRSIGGRKNALAGHLWPSGRVFGTPALES